MRLFRRPQPKEEHPMREEWDTFKQQAEKRGLLHNDGTFANPPSGFGCGVVPFPRVDPKLIGQEQR